MKRYGIFGGSFDPVHYGHLLFAEQAREAFGLDRVIFVPSGRSPHKPQGGYASGQDRVRMLELAIRETMGDMNPIPYSVFSGEVRSRDIHYTVDTLEEMRREYSGDRLFLLLGSDVLAGLHHWYRVQRICRLASVITVHRAGSPLPDFSLLAPYLSCARLA